MLTTCTKIFNALNCYSYKTITAEVKYFFKEVVYNFNKVTL